VRKEGTGERSFGIFPRTHFPVGPETVGEGYVQVGRHLFQPVFGKMREIGSASLAAPPADKGDEKIISGELDLGEELLVRHGEPHILMNKNIGPKGCFP